MPYSYFNISNILAIFCLVLLISCGSNNETHSQAEGQIEQIDEKAVNETKGRVLAFNKPLFFLDAEYQQKSSLDVEIADNEAARSLGLMDVYKMKMNQGMLFIFDRPQPLQFWMANTPLSLDILFVSADSTITHIHKNTIALSQENYTNDGQLGLFVVETNAGYTTLNDIQVGDRIRF